MNDEEIKKLHILQTKNVKKLNQAKVNLIKDINFYLLKKSDDFQVEIKTKLLALLYSAWSEAQFIQIVYTPLAFSVLEIEQIKRKRHKEGISAGWKEMVLLALQKVGYTNTKDLQNKRKKLEKIIEEYIAKPASLRNKIAHGQWLHALNQTNTAEQSDLTEHLANLDYVEIDRKFQIHKYLGFIIRDLVQSPQRTFYQDYWKHLTELEEFIDKTKNWNLETKKAELLKKNKSLIN